MQAVVKAPKKSSILHLLAETYFLLGQKEASFSYAERAFALQVEIIDFVTFYPLAGRYLI